LAVVRPPKTQRPAASGLFLFQHRNPLEHIRLLIGWDDREAVGSHVFLQSVIEKCSLPIDVTILTPKILKGLGIGTDGSNNFSKARFAGPFIYGFKGYSIFMDGADMLALVDLKDLWMQRDIWSAVQVVKHDYIPRNKRKYIGTALESKNESYPRKQWSSLILWNNNYYGHRVLTPEFVNEQPGNYLHRFSWIPDDRIGSLDKGWNYLVDEDNQAKATKIAHYTNGLPGFEHYRNSEHSAEWKQAWCNMNEGLQYPIHSER